MDVKVSTYLRLSVQSLPASSSREALRPVCPRRAALPSQRCGAVEERSIWGPGTQAGLERRQVFCLNTDGDVFFHLRHHFS